MGAGHAGGQFHRGLKSPEADFRSMEGFAKKVPRAGRDLDGGWREAVSQSSAALRREGVSVSNVVMGLRKRGARRGANFPPEGAPPLRGVVFQGKGGGPPAARPPGRAAAPP